MDIFELDARKFFLCGMRCFFGIWILYAGLMKWFSLGTAVFVGYITSQFDPTWSPHALNVGLAWLIMIAEPLIGCWILSGRCPRLAWTAAALQMFLLTFGLTLIKNPEVGHTWQYVTLTLACAALSGPKSKD